MQVSHFVQFLSLFHAARVSGQALIESSTLVELHRGCCGGSDNCTSLVSCPYLENTKTHLLECADGTFVDPWGHRLKWAACNEHGQRKRCPGTHPFMCAQPNQCANGTDFCCSTTGCLSQASGGLRTCPGFHPVPPPPVPDAPMAIEIGEEEANPHLYYNHRGPYLQCFDGTIVSTLDMPDEPACQGNKGGIAICPASHPKLCRGYQYNTAYPNYRAAPHCAMQYSECELVVNVAN